MQKGCLFYLRLLIVEQLLQEAVMLIGILQKELCNKDMHLEMVSMVRCEMRRMTALARIHNQMILIQQLKMIKLHRVIATRQY